MSKKVFKSMICLACIVFLTSNISAQSAKTLYKENLAKQTVTKKAENAKAPTVKSILQEMDKRMNRNCSQTMQMEVFEDNKLSKYTYKIKSKDNNQYILIHYTAPERWLNTDILMVEKDVIIYDRGSDRFLEVPDSMAFGGTDVAHGDMLRLNISANYDGEIINETADTWTVSLTTTNREMPYNGIEIVINKTGYYPVHAKCYAKSGKLIKTIDYTDLKELNGIVKPTRYTFLSTYEPDKYNVIQVLDETLAEYPTYIFNKYALRSGIDEQF